MSATGAGVRTTATAHDGKCRDAHISLTITSMDGEVRGAHLRRQRQLAGFSIRALAEAAHLSATRVRQIEDAERVTGRAVSRYLGGIVEAWRVRASDTAREECASARASAQLGVTAVGNANAVGDPSDDVPELLA